MKSILFFVLFFLGLTLVAFAQNNPKTDNDSRKEAERLWELAIEAKGGRERLHNIRNMVISSSSLFDKELKKPRIQVEEIYVFPDKWWSWNDQRPSRFGLSVTMYNWETGKQYVITDEEPNFIGLQPISSNLKNTNLAGVIPILLETKWNQPKPQRVSEGKIGSKRVDIIQTELLGKRIDFVLDKKTHLPIRVISYSDNQKSASKIRLEDYVSVEEIKMPSKVVFESSDNDFQYNRQYQFNVKYDETIFKSPLPLKSGSKVWKVKD
jgi:hypothetical protein